MDTSEITWLSQMGLESSIDLMEQCNFMDSFDEEVAVLLGQDLDNCLDAPSITIPSYNSVTELGSEPPAKLLKPNNYSNFTTINAQPNSDRASSMPIILNFDNNTENPGQMGVNCVGSLNPDEEHAVSQALRGQGSLPRPEEQSRRPQPTAKKQSRIRQPSQTYDHIIAERKRREQLSQRFMALSTIVPGLKKMDKTSVLGDAIKYLKHLQEKVKTLEEQATRQTMESVVLVKKSHIMVEDEKSECSDEQPLPEIEARVCNNHILLRVHCEKHKGVLVNLLSKVEKLNLAVITTNVTPFGSLAVDITIIAEMEKEFNLSMKEVVKMLRASI